MTTTNLVIIISVIVSVLITLIFALISAVCRKIYLKKYRGAENTIPKDINGTIELRSLITVLFVVSLIILILLFPLFYISTIGFGGISLLLGGSVSVASVILNSIIFYKSVVNFLTKHLLSCENSRNINDTEESSVPLPENVIEPLTEDKKRIRDLEKQLAEVEMDRDILKKALSIFCKNKK